MRNFSMRNNLFKSTVLLLFFMIVTMIAYYPTLSNAPLWDDWAFLFKSWTIRNISPIEFWTLGNHRRSWPVFFTTISYMYKNFGTNYLYYHVVNIVLHACNAFLVLKVLEKINGRNALLISLIFLLHPIHFFTVSWIIQIKTLLCIFFFLLSLLYFLDSQKRESKTLYWVSVFLFALSLLSKAVFAPLILLMGFYKKRIKMLPFALICLYSIVLTTWSTHLKSYVEKINITSIIATEVFANESEEKSEEAKEIYWPRPLGKTPVAPEKPLINLALSLNNLVKYTTFSIYPINNLLVHPSTKVNYTFLEMMSASLVVVAFVFLLLKYWETKNELSLVGLLFYLITIVPLTGLIYVPIFYYTNFVEYWLSVPILGIILCLSQIKWRPVLFTGFLGIIVVIFFIKTTTTSFANSNSVKILERSIEKSPHNQLLKVTLAKHYFYEKKYAESNKVLFNVKREHGAYNPNLDLEIEKNFKLMRSKAGEENEELTL